MLQGLRRVSNLDLVIAYEPVWAIGPPRRNQRPGPVYHSFHSKQGWAGTGKDVAQHVRILYGGSVTGVNIADLMTKDIDGTGGWRQPEGTGVHIHRRTERSRQEAVKKRLVVIVGPTAVGKSRLAVDLALELGGEIINADSRQVYRYMDIGTAKPSAAERAAVPHHLLDLVNPDEPFNLALYRRKSLQAIDDIFSHGKLPILVGGTGQYVWATVEGWVVPAVAPDLELRKILEEQAAQLGHLALYQQLVEADLDAPAIDRGTCAAWSAR